MQRAYAKVINNLETTFDGRLEPIGTTRHEACETGGQGDVSSRNETDQSDLPCQATTGHSRPRMTAP
jgi:hypothetical protein